MTARQLIEVLSKLENKDIPVFVYNYDTEDIHEFNIDLTLEDRIDLNITTQGEWYESI